MYYVFNHYTTEYSWYHLAPHCFVCDNLDRKPDRNIATEERWAQSIMEGRRSGWCLNLWPLTLWSSCLWLLRAGITCHCPRLVSQTLFHCIYGIYVYVLTEWTTCWARSYGNVLRVRLSEFRSQPHEYYGLSVRFFDVFVPQFPHWYKRE